MTDVLAVSAYEVYNVNPHKLEPPIHQFFCNSCLDIGTIDSNSKLHRPRKWFTAFLNVIEEAIKLIVSGKIINYRFDDLNDKIISLAKMKLHK
jgi:hypothetical protein